MTVDGEYAWLCGVLGPLGFVRRPLAASFRQDGGVEGILFHSLKHIKDTELPKLLDKPESSIASTVDYSRNICILEHYGFLCI